MRSTDSLERLDAALRNEIGAVAALLEILRQEQRALAQRDAAALDRIVPEKQRQVAGLETLGQSRTSALRAAGVTGDINAVAARLRSDERLSRPWRELLALLEQCRRLNQINGGMVEANRRYIERALAVLSGQTATDSETYGPSGAARAGLASRVNAKV